VDEELLELKEHEGWKKVEEYIKKRIKYHEQQLISCSLDDVIKHRERRDALNLLLLFVDQE
jgi:hypothetical protein